MTSHCYPSYCKSASRIPYVGRISAGENDDVEFIYQFVKHTKYKNNIQWENYYLIGTPTKFPNYGDFPQTFFMRTYGFDVSISPLQNKLFIYMHNTQTNESKMINNHIDILFYEAVYPIRVSIYEIYNPGNIIRISARDSNKQWCLLWEGSPQIVPPTSRLFSPPLQSCDFKTKRLRLEFKPSTWDYCTQLDAVMLIGTSELIVPKNREESLTNLLKRINCMYNFRYENEDVHNLTKDYKNAHLDIVHLQENILEYCIIRKSDLEKTFSKCNLDRENVSREIIPDYVQHFKQMYDSHRFLFKYDLNSAKRRNLSSDGSMELSYCNFSRLPDEIILEVLKNLDFRTLCRMSQVNKHFNNLTRDCKLYTCLSVQCINASTHMYNIFDYFTPRCKYLQQLNLIASKFSVLDFIKFLNNCGKQITHLRLIKCSSVDNDVLLKISKICKNLRKLDLSRCQLIEDKGYSYLQNLERLEHLRIGYPDDINTQTLCKILQKNQQMRELYLEMMNVNLKEVAIELKNSCRNLEVISLINCSYLYSMFSVRQKINFIITALADYKNLRKIILYTTCIFVDKKCLNRLFSSCQHLEEVYLSRILGPYLNLLTQCKNLKKLHVHDVTFETCSVIFEQCPKLQELYLIGCGNKKFLLNQWRERYPHVSVFVKTQKYIQGEGEYIDIDIDILE